jgi:CheY-like chemotaxis protein
MMAESKPDILIVDDDEGHTELVRRNLRRLGITNTVIALNNGRAALDYVFRIGAFASRQNGHLLVLLDINMPGGLDGVEVLRQIKLDPEKRKILVIMLTTTDDPREVDTCYALGCNVYMTKPIDPSQFMEALTRLGLFISVVSVPAEEETA